jgi:hypothetical protein
MSSLESSINVPPHWGDDSLSDFVSLRITNTLATFVRRPADFRLLARIDKCFVQITENLSNPPNILSAMLLIRAHSAFRGAVRLSVSGQVADTFPLLRACLEYALYALHIFTNPALGATWLRRHDDEASLKAVRQQFTNSGVLKARSERRSTAYHYKNTLRKNHRLWWPSK